MEEVWPRCGSVPTIVSAPAFPVRSHERLGTFLRDYLNQMSELERPTLHMVNKLLSEAQRRGYGEGKFCFWLSVFILAGSLTLLLLSLWHYFADIRARFFRLLTQTEKASRPPGLQHHIGPVDLYGLTNLTIFLASRSETDIIGLARLYHVSHPLIYIHSLVCAPVTNTDLMYQLTTCKSFSGRQPLLLATSPSS